MRIWEGSWAATVAWLTAVVANANAVIDREAVVRRHDVFFESERLVVSDSLFNTLTVGNGFVPLSFSF